MAMVGSVVQAEDPDPNTDPLIYTLSGADAGLFTVDGNGQIMVGANTKLDYETRNSYMVTLTAEDSFGATASIPVTIRVNDLNEVPDVAGDAAVEYPGERHRYSNGFHCDGSGRDGNRLLVACWHR